MAEFLYLLYITWPLWAFLSTLSVALWIEEGILARNRKQLVDNPALK